MPLFPFTPVSRWSTSFVSSSRISLFSCLFIIDTLTCPLLRIPSIWLRYVVEVDLPQAALYVLFPIIDLLSIFICLLVFLCRVGGRDVFLFLYNTSFPSFTRITHIWHYIVVICLFYCFFLNVYNIISVQCI